MDDIWDDEDIYETRDSVGNAEIKRVHTKQGYLDGLTHAQESSLQFGFDDGYPKGAQLGVRVGYILSTVLCYESGMFEECKGDLNISKVLDKSYFNDDLEVGKHQALEKWERICKDIRESR